MDPLTIYQDAGMLGIAVMLFIANFIQNSGIKKANEQVVTDLKQANLDAGVAHKETVSRLSASIQLLIDGQGEADKRMSAIHQNHALLETLKLGQDRALKDLTDVIRNQEILAANQMNLTHTTNEVVRELITIIKDGERG